MAERISLNRAATMRCRELNRLDPMRRVMFCNGELSDIIDAATQCPDVCQGVCSCERNGEELNKRFLLEYNIAEDLGMNFTAGDQEIPSRKCKYVYELKNKGKICKYPHVKRACPVSFQEPSLHKAIRFIMFYLRIEYTL